MKLTALLVPIVAAGCGRVFSLENHPCPCVTGYTCDTARNTCVLSTCGPNDECPSIDAPSSNDAPSSDDAAPAPPPLSCVGLPATCGSDGHDDCCTSPEVAGGVLYFRSYDRASDEQFGSTLAPATVSSFRLDKYEVTVGRFRAFVEAGMGTQKHLPMAGAGAHGTLPGSGWDERWNSNLEVSRATLEVKLNCWGSDSAWTGMPGPNENQPMNCLSWYEAMAFCAWDGGFLPTEAEWNYAATGGDEQRAYPWSSPASSLTIDGSYASYADGTNLATTDVGMKPKGDGRWGQSDLAGNVWEWTLDWSAVYSSSCTDCANVIPPPKLHDCANLPEPLVDPQYRVMRGGCSGNRSDSLRTGYRYQWNEPCWRNAGVGVRCARPL